MQTPTLKGPFRIFYKNKPVKINGTPSEGMSWEYVLKKEDATQFPTFEGAKAHLEALQFTHARDVEIAPLAYDPQDQPSS